MSIFVIDDHPLMREAVAMLVRRASPNTPVVELGRIALVAQSVEKHGMPQLICLELKLPDTHGVSGIRELKRSYPEVPIVVLTASPASDYEDLAIEAGAAAFLEKSAGVAEIAQVLKAFLAEEAGAESEAPVAVGKLVAADRKLTV